MTVLAEAISRLTGNEVDVEMLWTVTLVDDRCWPSCAFGPHPSRRHEKQRSMFSMLAMVANHVHSDPVIDVSADQRASYLLKFRVPARLLETAKA